MDISMPRLDGVEAARQIKKKRKSAAVLMLTGSSSAADVARAREAGAERNLTRLTCVIGVLFLANTIGLFHLLQ